MWFGDRRIELVQQADAEHPEGADVGAGHELDDAPNPGVLVEGRLPRRERLAAVHAGVAEEFEQLLGARIGEVRRRSDVESVVGCEEDEGMPAEGGQDEGGRFIGGRCDEVELVQDLDDDLDVAVVDVALGVTVECGGDDLAEMRRELSDRDTAVDEDRREHRHDSGVDDVDGWIRVVPRANGEEAFVDERIDDGLGSFDHIEVGPGVVADEAVAIRIHGVGDHGDVDDEAGVVDLFVRRRDVGVDECGELLFLGGAEPTVVADRSSIDTEEGDQRVDVTNEAGRRGRFGEDGSGRRHVGDGDVDVRLGRLIPVDDRLALVEREGVELRHPLLEQGLQLVGIVDVRQVAERRHHRRAHREVARVGHRPLRFGHQAGGHLPDAVGAVGTTVECR